MTPSFQWNDAFLLNEQLSDDERAIQEAARQYCQDKLQTRVLMAARHEHFDREIMNEMGAMGLLGCTIEGYAQRGGQVFISSHSPHFLNALNLEEIYCLRKEDGFTKISLASESANLRALVEAGDLPGWLWKQGLLEGLN